MKRTLAALALGLTCTAAFAGGIDLQPNPDWCKPGFRCLRVSEYEAMTEKKIELERDFSLAQAKSRRFGFTIGPGVGVAAVVQEGSNGNFDVSYIPSPGIFAVWGLRF